VQKIQGGKMALENLQELYVHKLQDLYSAESQIIETLPRMIKNAYAPELQRALQEHLNITEKQAQRLEQVTKSMGEDVRGKKCVGMEGLLKEGAELIKEGPDPDVLDAGIIAAAQSVEHYEIAGYGTAIAWAKLLGYGDAANMLVQTLNEEKQADELLTSIAENMINEQALNEGEREDQEFEMHTASARKA
jgi:ferritin-like metal-binding protein YciE